MQLLILDDDTKSISWMVEEIEFILVRNDIDTKIFQKPKELIEYSIYHRDIFLAILDINLCDQEFDGITVAQRIKFFNSHIIIIFCSACIKKYTERLLKTEFIALGKDELKELPSTILQAKKEYDAVHNTGSIEYEYIFYKVKYVVNLNEVLYFTSAGHKVIIKKLDGESFFYDKLDNVEEDIKELAGKKFIRISKSYLVNIDYIEGKEKNKIKVGNNWIKITRNFKTNINL